MEVCRQSVTRAGKTTTRQAATGAGASNQDNAASVAGSGFNAIDQGGANIHFPPLW